jgi:L-ribulose-5-phosphate 4-epimerase
MLLHDLRAAVLEANLELVRAGLVSFTFGNASGIDRATGLMAIKPSGVPYERLTPATIVVLDATGKVLEGGLRPSSDWPTHLALYQSFGEIGGVAHTHSEFATAWAQARRAIPCLGTTHADYFHGPVPVTDSMTTEEIASGYEANTAAVITRAFRTLDYRAVPAVLVANHGPFTWGATPADAAHHAGALEIVARIAYRARVLDATAPEIAGELHDKHFRRKHGATAYYGQPENR